MTRYGEWLGKAYCMMSDGKLVEGELYSAVTDYNCLNEYSVFFRQIPRRYDFFGAIAYKDKDRAAFLISKTVLKPKVIITGVGSDEQLINDIMNDIYAKTAIEEDGSVEKKRLKERSYLGFLIKLGVDIGKEFGVEEFLKMMRDEEEGNKRKGKAS